jgi:hypothetical protein
MINTNEVIKTAGNEDIQLHFKGYADTVYKDDSYFSGDPANGIALANWNHVEESVAEELSRMGVCLEEVNDFGVCCGCSKVVRMLRPDSLSTGHSWTKDAAEVGCDDEKEVFCGNCVRQNPADVIVEVLSDPRRCITVKDVDLPKFGFEEVLSHLERGVKEGQNADPKTISDSLASMGVTQFLFVMGHASAEAISFSLYVNSDELQFINDPADIVTSGFSMKTVMGDAMEQLATNTVTGEAGTQNAMHTVVINENNRAATVTHEEACHITKTPDMGMRYLQEIKRIISAEENKSNESPEEIWNSHSFRRVVFRTVGANREGEIDRARADARRGFYSADDIRMFYRRVLPALMR